MALRVILDYDLCQSNGNCLDECPEVFALDAEDQPEVVCREPAEGLREKVEFAALCCPRSAIKVLVDERDDCEDAGARTE